MTRTPLLGSLQRLYRDFTEHEATGRPLAEIHADRRLRTTRRDFLKIAATVGQNLWHIGAHNAGVPVGDLVEACPRRVGGLPKGL